MQNDTSDETYITPDEAIANYSEDETVDSPVEDSPEDEKFISQKELDRILQKRLKRQEDQLRKKYADYDERLAESESFRKLQEEKATDAERWEKERERLLSSLQERDTELTKLQRQNLIADLASERGLPKSFWKRVQGETEEEIAEDMDSIVKDLGLDKSGAGKETTPKAVKKTAVYGGGGETEDPEPDTDFIVSKIPRGPQIRVDKPRAFK